MARVELQKPNRVVFQTNTERLEAKRVQALLVHAHASSRKAHALAKNAAMVLIYTNIPHVELYLVK
jgi:hypothetical protein